MTRQKPDGRSMGWGLLVGLALFCVVGWFARPAGVLAGPQAAGGTGAGQEAPGESDSGERAIGDSADADVLTDEITVPEDDVVVGDLVVPAELPPWIRAVDDFFAQYLVKPLATVIFADLRHVFGVENVRRTLGIDTEVPFVVAWLFCGALFFTIRMGFINIRGFWHAIRLTKGDYDKPGDVGEVSHFQALSAALSATVGLGNIAGVALAIGIGGPGACFWMIIVGLLGMTSKFAECTLGQMYRKIEKDGTVSGGPMQYLKTGLSEMNLGSLGVILSTLFALLCIGASFGGGCAFQVGQSLTAIQGEIELLQRHPWIYGVVMAVLAGAVIIGGIKSIGRVAGKIVPFMCAAYVLASLYILTTNAQQIPGAAWLIIEGAFSPVAVQGGLVGVLVQGIRRAVFSNEAGVGSAAIAHSAAKTDEPVSEGIVALLEPFIDTVVVCTMTALVIVITGSYRVPTELERQNSALFSAAELDDQQKASRDEIEAQTPEDQLHVRGLIDGSDGAALTKRAFIHGGPDWFRHILNAAVVLFAFSTLISWSYYGERCWTSLFGIRASMAYKILFLVFVVLGSIVTRGNILDFSDMLILGMSFPNILGVLLLSGRVKRKLDDYWDRYKSGELEVTKH